MKTRVQEKSSGLFKATGIVMTATLLSACVGLVREMLLAYRFGAAVETDAYFFTFELMVHVPEFILSAIAAALIPVYMRTRQEGKSADFISTIFGVYSVFLLLAGGVVLAMAPLISSTLAAGFDSEGRQLVTRLLWMLSPTILLTGLWGVFKTLLEAERKFFVSNISNAFISLGVIGAVLLLTPYFGIQSLAFGILIATLIRLLWGAYWLSRTGFRCRFMVRLRDPQFRRFLVLLWPGLVGAGMGALIPIIDQSMASHLTAGTVAAISFAGRPVAILRRVAVFSFVTALLPTLALKALRSNPNSYEATVSRTLGILFFAVTPLSLFLAVLRVPIMQLLFERGRFGPEATARSASIFAALVLGLMPMAISVTLSTVFASLEDTKTPAFFGAGGNLVSKIIFNCLLIGPFGAVGLAAASSLQYVASCAILLFLMQRRLHGIRWGSLGLTVSKALAASLFAALPAQVIVSMGSLPPLVAILSGLISSAIVYAASSALLRTPELSLVWDYLLVVRKHRLFAGVRVGVR